MPKVGKRLAAKSDFHECLYKNAKIYQYCTKIAFKNGVLPILLVMALLFHTLNHLASLADGRKHTHLPIKSHFGAQDLNTLR